MNDVMATTTVLERLEGKLDALTAEVAQLRSTQEAARELYADMAPVASKALGIAGERLAALESRGYFAFGRELLGVLDSVVAGYSPEDVHDLADNVVRILELVKRATQPEVLDMADQAMAAADHAGDGAPPGVLGLLRATSKDEELRRGMVVVMEVLRQLGRHAHPTDPGTAVARINPLLGNQRNLAGSAPVASRSHGAAASPSRPAASAPSATASAPAAAPAATFEGLPITDDGFLQDPAQWTRELAVAMAEQLGVGALGERHWKVLDFARSEFETTGASPNVRRLTSGSGVPVRELYGLFPRAPAKTAARIAGIPKPVGCL
ncbi:MAG: TusE/DsrC/DsvC family sulfur relay protein [Nannocystaceae bacterium]